MYPGLSMLRATVVVIAALLAFPLLSGAAATTGERYIVGYSEGDEEAARAAVLAAGGEIQRHNGALRVFVVETSDPARFELLVSSSGAIEYVETDDPTRLDGAQWNGAQWNGAQWNGAQWNGAQWNGAQWNGAQWNGATDGTEVQRQAARWSIQHFDAQGGSKFKYDAATTDPGLIWQWGAWATRAPDAWKTVTGTRSATLCVLDSGLAWDHPDVADNVWTGPGGEHGWNARDPTASAYDDAGHGTHVSGVAAATLGNAFGVAGVGNVQVMTVKVLGADGTGHESDLAFGLAWCGDQGASVALMALHATEPGPTLDRALQYAADRDVLLVGSAGNGGPCSDCVVFPASDPRVVAVAAVDGGLDPAAFASRGPQVEVAAPGVHVLGPFPGDAFVFGSGSSQAAAYAAGLAASLRDAAPWLSASEARALLSSTAQDIGAPGPDDATGAGLVRVDKALQATA